MNLTTKLTKIVTGLALVATAMLNTACPDKGNRGGAVQATPPVVPGPCYGTGCVQGGGGVLAQALGKYINYQNQDQMHLGLVFTAMNATAPVATGYYAGQAAATGTLIVRTPIQSMFCPVPAGSYQVVTITPGTWQGQSFGGMYLEARGPVVIQFKLPNNYVKPALTPTAGADGIQYPYQLQLYMVIDKINGVACSYPSNTFVLE